MMYFGDPWYENLDGSVKNLVVQTVEATGEIYIYYIILDFETKVQ